MLVGPSNLSVSGLVVVTMADEVAPACLSQTLYRRDAGNGWAYHPISRRGWDWVAAPRHLVGRQARAHVWPEIISWIKTHS
jgi:hypothetical protein